MQFGGIPIISLLYPISLISRRTFDILQALRVELKVDALPEEVFSLGPSPITIS